VHPNGPTALYRAFADDGALLYIGVSADPEVRYTQHAGDKPWWPEVAAKTTEWFETRALALAAETAAIKTELPRYNRQHSPLWPTRVPIPEGSVSVSEFRRDMSKLVGIVEQTGAHIGLYSRTRQVAVLVPAAVAEWYEELARAAGA